MREGEGGFWWGMKMYINERSNEISSSRMADYCPILMYAKLLFLSHSKRQRQKIRYCFVAMAPANKSLKQI